MVALLSARYCCSDVESQPLENLTTKPVGRGSDSRFLNPASSAKVTLASSCAGKLRVLVTTSCTSAPASAEDLWDAQKKSAPQCLTFLQFLGCLAAVGTSPAAHLTQQVIRFSILSASSPTLPLPLAQLWEQALSMLGRGTELPFTALLPGDAAFPAALPLLLTATLASGSPWGCQEHPGLLPPPLL